MRAIVCWLLLVALVWPSVAACGGAQAAVVKATGEGGGTKPVSLEEELSPIVLYIIWKFVEGFGWIVVGICLGRMWEFVNSGPDMVEDRPPTNGYGESGCGGPYGPEPW